MFDPDPTIRLRHWLGGMEAVAESVWKRVQDRMLKAILLVGAAGALAAGWLIELQPGEVRPMLLLFNLFCALLVIFIGATEIPRDRSTRNIQFFLSKPLSRGQYVTGKFVGVLVIAESIFLAYAVCFLAAAAARGQGAGDTVLMDCGRLALQLATVTGLVVGLSAFLPELAATILSFAIFLLSFVVFLIPPLTQLLIPAWLRPIFLTLYYPLPNLQHFLWVTDATHGILFLLTTATYTAAYCVGALMIAELFLRRRDLF